MLMCNVLTFCGLLSTACKLDVTSSRGYLWYGCYFTFTAMKWAHILARSQGPEKGKSGAWCYVSSHDYVLWYQNICYAAFMIYNNNNNNTNNNNNNNNITLLIIERITQLSP